MMTELRPDGRTVDELRPLEFILDIQPASAGSVLIKWGRTHVICAVSIEEKVPHHRIDSGGGWITAEYAMLPGSSAHRVKRARDGVRGRTAEIQRLIGRSLRACFDLDAIGPRTIRVDCDVLNADGGTRCASITGAYVAVSIALQRHFAATGHPPPTSTPLTAVSIGVVDGRVVTDLCYAEDHIADVDLNFVAVGSGIVEIQGTAEGAFFTQDQLMTMVQYGQQACTRISERQLAVLDKLESDR
ncbi:MAG: ribonuclease PH [Myxococcota bacterium]|nr:ribonuclease PH [Myxococcota bacterium]